LIDWLIDWLVFSANFSSISTLYHGVIKNKKTQQKNKKTPTYFHETNVLNKI
jgi:hypothetical protein